MQSVGVDLVSISEIRGMLEAQGGAAFAARTFTEAEREAAQKTKDPAAYLASRFACKKAVYKALAHFTEEQTFDFRVIETLNERDGFPLLVVHAELKRILDEGGFSGVSVSISAEGDLITAVALAW